MSDASENIAEGTRAGFGEAARLAALDSYGILDTPREPDFDDLVRIAAEVCEVPIAVVNLVASDRQFFKAEIGLGVRETPLDTSFCRHAILAEDFLEVPDAAEDIRFAGNPLVHEAPGLRFYAGAILKSADGLALGTMCVLDYQPRRLNAHQVRMLRLLARQAMAQIEMRKLIAERDASIEELRDANRRRAVLTRELSHRMKNTLAVVQSIVGQTFRTARTMEESREAISSRLGALARAQDVLTGSATASTDIVDIIQAALAPHREDDDRISTEGAPVTLNEQQSLGLTLALHELATNAWKYGALSVPHGHAAISWSVVPSGDFVLRWVETNGPPVEPPSRRGFGSRLIERIVGSYFSGEAQLDFQPDGVRFVLRGQLAEND